MNYFACTVCNCVYVHNVYGDGGAFSFLFTVIVTPIDVAQWNI